MLYNSYVTVLYKQHNCYITCYITVMLSYNSHTTYLYNNSYITVILSYTCDIQQNTTVI